MSLCGDGISVNLVKATGNDYKIIVAGYTIKQDHTDMSNLYVKHDWAGDIGSQRMYGWIARR